MKKLRFISCCFVLLFSKTSTAQSNNFDFELTPPGVYTTSNAVSGWTISSATTTNNCTLTNTWIPGSSEFALLNTPVLNVPFIGTILGSPLGGATIAQLNNNVANSSCTKLARTITVTPLYNSFQLAYAAILEGGHSCCDQPSFYFTIKDAQNILATCQYSLIAPSASCANGATGYSVTGSTIWTNWQLRFIDLSAYTGSVVTIEFIINDCTLGDHYATLYLDPRLGNSYVAIPPSSTLISAPNPVNYCAGSGVASITGPLGHTSYQWYALSTIFPFSVPLGTTSVLNINNPIPGGTYSLNVVNSCGQSSYLYTLTPTTVNISAFELSPSCINAASGSASVTATGSGSGYNYIWKNSSNQTISISSSVYNLAPGVYSVMVGAFGTAGCGTATHVFTIATHPTELITLTKLFCSGAQASLTAAGGANYQWYNNLTAITPTAGGNASTYVVISPTLGAIYYLSYTSLIGCKDSIKFMLSPTPPGTISVFQNGLICPGSSTGSALITMTATQGAPAGMRSFHVYSNNLIPPYSSSIAPSSQIAFTASNLTAGQIYSVNASDGFCSYTRTFSVNFLNFDYTVGPASQTICSGSSLAVGVNFIFPALPSGYTYSWSPTTFFGNNPGIFHFTSITPTTAPGSSSTFIYSVTVTPTIMNCPLTKTLAVTVTSLVTPTISAIPALCHNSSNFTVQVNPSGGIFLNNSNLFLGTTSGVISPSLAVIGINTFTYMTSAASCSSSTTASFIVNSVPLTVSNTTQIFCGQTATLFASGADIYQWNNGNTNSSITVAPISTTIYTVTGISTTNLCSETKTTQVSVTSSLVVSILGSSTLCIGNTGALSATGANTYTWNSGAISPNILISPQIATSYSVTGSDILGCKSSTQIQVFVYSLPHPLVAGNFSICPGVETTLNAYNVYSFLWNTGATTNTILVSPSVTTIYTVTGIDFYGCKNTKTVTVVVSGCVGLEDLSQNTSLVSIYPNPNNGIFSIEAAGKINLLITDALGKVIFEKEFEQGHSSLNLSSHMNGIYFVKTVYKGEVKIIKLVKTN